MTGPCTQDESQPWKPSSWAVRKLIVESLFPTRQKGLGPNQPTKQKHQNFTSWEWCCVHVHLGWCHFGEIVPCVCLSLFNEIMLSPESKSNKRLIEKKERSSGAFCNWLARTCLCFACSVRTQQSLRRQASSAVYIVGAVRETFLCVVLLSVSCRLWRNPGRLFFL